MALLQQVCVSLLVAVIVAWGTALSSALHCGAQAGELCWYERVWPLAFISLLRLRLLLNALTIIMSVALAAVAAVVLDLRPRRAMDRTLSNAAAVRITDALMRIARGMRRSTLYSRSSSSGCHGVSSSLLPSSSPRSAPFPSPSVSRSLPGSELPLPWFTSHSRHSRSQTGSGNSPDGSCSVPCVALLPPAPEQLSVRCSDSALFPLLSRARSTHATAAALVAELPDLFADAEFDAASVSTEAGREHAPISVPLHVNGSAVTSRDVCWRAVYRVLQLHAEELKKRMRDSTRDAILSGSFEIARPAIEILLSRSPSNAEEGAGSICHCNLAANQCAKPRTTLHRFVSAHAVAASGRCDESGDGDAEHGVQLGAAFPTLDCESYPSPSGLGAVALDIGRDRRCLVLLRHGRLCSAQHVRSVQQLASSMTTRQTQPIVVGHHSTSTEAPEPSVLVNVNLMGADERRKTKLQHSFIAAVNEAQSSVAGMAVISLNFPVRSFDEIMFPRRGQRWALGIDLETKLPTCKARSEGEAEDGEKTGQRKRKRRRGRGPVVIVLIVGLVLEASSEQLYLRRCSCPVCGSVFRSR